MTNSNYCDDAWMVRAIDTNHLGKENLNDTEMSNFMLNQTTDADEKDQDSMNFTTIQEQN